MLAEAGYPNGFRIDLVTAIRDAPAEVETCEAIATMWGNVGIDVRLQRIPYETLRPQLVARTFGGATCHNVSQRLEPVLGLSNYIDKSVFSYGTFHPWLEENVPDAMEELDEERRFQKTAEVYDWFTMQQVLGVGLYSLDGVVPVGPRIQPWEYVSYSDVRIPNGYENVMHQ